MKKLSRVATGTWGKVVELWKEGHVTDAIMTSQTIAVYHHNELIHAERIGEEEIHSFVDETIPADYEQVWKEEIRKGELFKYSFLLSEEVVVRCLLWNFGLSLRFIPTGKESEKLVEENVLRLVDNLPFFILHTGRIRSGKTTRIAGQVRRLLKNPDVKVFVYSNPQEVYVGEAEGVMVHVSSSNMKFDDFLDLVALSGADVVVVQSMLSKEDWDNLNVLFGRGISIIVEVGSFGRVYPSSLPDSAVEVREGKIRKGR